MAWTDRFLCVLCGRLYVHRGRYDAPSCPHCGCQSSVFPEWLARHPTRSRAR